MSIDFMNSLNDSTLDYLKHCLKELNKYSTLNSPDKALFEEKAFYLKEAMLLYDQSIHSIEEYYSLRDVQEYISSWIETIDEVIFQNPSNKDLLKKHRKHLNILEISLKENLIESYEKLNLDVPNPINYL